jgi:hypothetical protein
MDYTKQRKQHLVRSVLLSSSSSKLHYATVFEYKFLIIKCQTNISKETTDGVGSDVAQVIKNFHQYLIFVRLVAILNKHSC